jgi:acetyl-CoA acyltransferase 1
MAGFVQKGLKNILQKNPQDVVFLSALRTPITRAKKGGLRDAYDHELLAAVCLIANLMAPPLS